MYGGEVTRGGCLPLALVAVDSVLALIDGAIAVFAFSQLLRIHSCSQQLGWTRQKMFHLMIGTSNIGYLVYFLSTIAATCKGWPCWSHGCGFILMASPQILFLAAFLLLLSFWVDLCHQANDDDDDDNDDHEEEQTNYNEALLEKSKTKSCSLRVDTRRKCCPFQFIHVGSRQKFVVLVVVVTFLLMIGFSVLIWIGEGRNPIDSSFVARVYLDVFSAAIFLLGGALACYGGLLFTKMRKVRSEMVSTEMWKVAGLAAVSLVCFTSCSLLALVTSVPVIYDWQSEEHMDVRNTSLLLFLYYFIGSSVPSALVLWETREMPSRHAMDNQAEARVVTFVNDRSPAENHPQSWTITASLQNQFWPSSGFYITLAMRYALYSCTCQNSGFKSKPHITTLKPKEHVSDLFTCLDFGTCGAKDDGIPSLPGDDLIKVMRITRKGMPSEADRRRLALANQNNPTAIGGGIPSYACKY